MTRTPKIWRQEVRILWRQDVTSLLSVTSRGTVWMWLGPQCHSQDWEVEKCQVEKWLLGSWGPQDTFLSASKCISPALAPFAPNSQAPGLTGWGPLSKQNSPKWLLPSLLIWEMGFHPSCPVLVTFSERSTCCSLSPALCPALIFWSSWCQEQLKVNWCPQHSGNPRMEIQGSDVLFA
jgi:hypothetical protein